MFLHHKNWTSILNTDITYNAYILQGWNVNQLLYKKYEQVINTIILTTHVEFNIAIILLQTFSTCNDDILRLFVCFMSYVVR